MLEQEFLDQLQLIRLTKPADVVTIDNPTAFPLIGQGKQGVVFRIDDQRCVKIYFRKQSQERELHALLLGGRAGICPRVHFWGESYIVMDYLSAPTLFDHLQQYGMTKELASRILSLLDIFEAIGFNRFDHSARHIFMLPDQQMKIIDLVHVIKPRPVYLAKKLISDMKEHAPAFLQYTEELHPKWHQRWISDQDYAELFAQIEEIKAR